MAKKKELVTTETFWWQYEAKAKQLLLNIESLEDDLMFLDGDFDNPDFVERFSELSSNEEEFREVCLKLEEAQSVFTWVLLNKTKPRTEEFAAIKAVYERLRSKFSKEEESLRDRILSMMLLMKQSSFETSLFKVSMKMNISLEVENEEEAVLFVEEYLAWERKTKFSETLSDSLLSYAYGKQDMEFLQLCDVKYSGTFSRGIEKKLSIPLTGDKSGIKYLKANFKDHPYETPGTFEIILGETVVKVKVEPGLHITNRVKPDKDLPQA